VVDAYLLVAQRMYRTGDSLIPQHGVFNVGAPAISSLKLVQKIMDLMLDRLEDPIVLGQANDQHDEQMDSSRIKALGWEPKYTLEQGLEKTITWFREHQRVAV